MTLEMSLNLNIQMNCKYWKTALQKSKFRIICISYPIWFCLNSCYFLLEMIGLNNQPIKHLFVLIGIYFENFIEFFFMSN